MIRHSRLTLALARLASIAAGAARAENFNDRPMIIIGNSGHVIYDDGCEDLFCVTRRCVSGPRSPYLTARDALPVRH